MIPFLIVLLLNILICFRKLISTTNKLKTKAKQSFLSSSCSVSGRRRASGLQTTKRNIISNQIQTFPCQSLMDEILDNQGHPVVCVCESDFTDHSGDEGMSSFDSCEDTGCRNISQALSAMFALSLLSNEMIPQPSCMFISRVQKH